jgi:hypothetical protein
MKTQIESSIDWNLLYPIESAGNGMFNRDHNGVKEIYTARDKKAEFIVYEDKTLVFVKSALGYPAIYPLPEVSFEKKATAILMDLDGTSVRSEKFWMWVIELTIGKLLNNNKFSLQHEDEPHVSGHSVSEHLQYCIDKYCPWENSRGSPRYLFSGSGSRDAGDSGRQGQTWSIRAFTRVKRISDRGKKGRNKNRLGNLGLARESLARDTLCIQDPGYG